MKKLLNSFICLIGIAGIVLVLIEILSRVYFHKELVNSTTARIPVKDLINEYVSRARVDIPKASTDEFIVFIGDSFTYGDTLPAKEAYPAVFQRCLQRKGRKEKVLNLGVRANNLLDHAAMIEELMKNDLAHLKIKKVILGLTQNDRYIEPWSLHPYDACPDLYPYSNTRFLHHYLFSVYYFDYLVTKKSHFLQVDNKTEKCLKSSVDRIKNTLKQRGIPLVTTFLVDAVKTPTSMGITKNPYKEFANVFASDFQLDLILINKIFDNIPSDREVYAKDNYHLNTSTNAMIGEYLCDEIKI